METKSGLMVNALLEHFHPGAFSQWLNYLDPKSRLLLSKIPIPGTLPSTQDCEVEHLIKKIHYSWFPPLLKDLPEQLQEIYLASLPLHHQHAVCHLLRCPPSKINLNPLVSYFFLKKIYESLCDEKTVPRAFLPLSPLNEVLDLSKEHLVSLIDLLGLYDLALDLQPVMDKRVIDQIYTHLSDHQKRYLRHCMQQQISQIHDRQPILKWVVEKEAFTNRLHRMGLYRFGIAFLEESESLLWYVSHFLDIGRGTVLYKMRNALEIKLSQKQINQVRLQVVTLVSTFRMQLFQKADGI